MEAEGLASDFGRYLKAPGPFCALQRAAGLHCWPVHETHLGCCSCASKQVPSQSQAPAGPAFLFGSEELGFW